MEHQPRRYCTVQLAGYMRWSVHGSRPSILMDACGEADSVWEQAQQGSIKSHLSMIPIFRCTTVTLPEHQRLCGIIRTGRMAMLQIGD